MAAGLYDITNDVLGKGHFAIVKLARHCLTGEHVAIKIVDKIKLTKEGLEQLSSEIKLWSILSRNEHPNVVKLYQCIDTRTKLYLVMEYCGNNVCDLYDYIQKKNDGDGLDSMEAKHIFKQICKAIYYCHSLKIVHRDLKPENILIINNRQLQQQQKSDILVKLIDFGFSNQWCEDELLRTSCGSLAYSAPEILLGNQYDGPKVDIWALGCILYILLYGHNPFMQFNDNETLIKILDCSFTTPEKPSVNELSIDLIRSLLKKDPNMRLSIDQILNHPWLNEQEDLSSTTTTTTTLPTTIDLTTMKKEQQQIKIGNKNHVNDFIIDQMINQGISISKDQIKKILHNEHIVDSIESTTDKDNNSPSIEYSVNDHHYIKATYHLLKDKSTRELIKEEGQTNSDFGNNNNKFRQNKRGNIATTKTTTTGRRRRDFIRSDSHTVTTTTTGLTNDNNLDKKKNNFLPLSLPSEHTQSLINLELPQNSTTSYVLPLARKCSIVSEEGSICAENNSLQDSNSLTCFDSKIQESSSFDDGDNGDNNGGGDNHQKKHLIDIFVTDSSTTNIDNQNKIMNPSENCDNQSMNVISIVSDLHPNHKKESILHPVSSSPDFLKSTDNDDGTIDSNNFGLNETNNEKSLFECLGSNNIDKQKIITNVRTKQSSATTNKFDCPPSITTTTNTNQSPSMRVIIQSKSLNNIAFIEHYDEGNNDNNDSNTVDTKYSHHHPHHYHHYSQNNTTKMTNSMSTVNIKQINHHNNNSNNSGNNNNRTEKNDCCRID
ncbi:hypothetical protein DERP_002577 [Dermatophagoides pteronyssinus]|uniref:Protein kinase domain-containing protein n=1 Tax=Dermatophagoides pteronyssinus TaxID=6956 RepID=A0ABQ8JIP7_DERPT|nr:hypothetical protein DERP_002577 [Dermatophagoides pteronyssinus]